MGIVLVERHINKPQFKLTKKDAKKSVIFKYFVYFNFFCSFKLSICQFLHSLNTDALGNRLFRHGLATALVVITYKRLGMSPQLTLQGSFTSRYKDETQN